jgi:hypothetical protein
MNEYHSVDFRFNNKVQEMDRDPLFKLWCVLFLLFLCLQFSLLFVRIWFPLLSFSIHVGMKTTAERPMRQSSVIACGDHPNRSRRRMRYLCARARPRLGTECLTLVLEGKGGK